MRVPLLVIAAVVAANGAARSQPQAAPDPGPCTFDELVDGGTFARDLRDTTAARQRREADWNTLDRMVGAPLRRVYENIDAVELIGWNQLPATRRPDGRTPAEMWLQVNDNYGTARTYLGIGQIYDYAIDPGPPFSVRVDTTYVAEPAGTRRRSVGVDVFTPGGCVISLRIAGAPNSPRLAPGAVADEVARLQAAVLERFGPIEFAPERRWTHLQFLFARDIAPVLRPATYIALWLATAAIPIVALAAYVRRRRRKAA